jgi:hypothetical protein
VGINVKLKLEVDDCVMARFCKRMDDRSQGSECDEAVKVGREKKEEKHTAEGVAYK